ncbi:MAG TPA: hypothetical protein DDW27_14245 [Bacteroidales bacterium]|nr:hypothetical protein [Bacteroidales bacterium]
MKELFLKCSFLLIFSLSTIINTRGNDSLKYSFSFNFYSDLSDTYLGGSLIMGEFAVNRTWYGASLAYGHFISQSTFKFRIIVEEISKTVDIPIEEMAIMQMGTLSIFIRPIQKRWINTDILFGVAIANAKSSILESVYYNYSFAENRFTYLYRDYQLVKRTHFGYQAGFNISFFPVQKFGIQLNSRIQHLNNGGSFFFVGSGIIFRL